MVCVYAPEFYICKYVYNIFIYLYMYIKDMYICILLRTYECMCIFQIENTLHFYLGTWNSFTNTRRKKSLEKHQR